MTTFVRDDGTAITANAGLSRTTRTRSTGCRTLISVHRVLRWICGYSTCSEGGRRAGERAKGSGLVCCAMGCVLQTSGAYIAVLRSGGSRWPVGFSWCGETSGFEASGVLIRDHNEMERTMPLRLQCGRPARPLLSRSLC